MRVAVLVKQIPKPEDLRLVAGRLVRDGVPLETNAFCRRANARAVELAEQFGGEVVVITMGAPAAAATLREMVACGASRAVLVSDPLLAGSDTLVTSRVLADVLQREGPFDLVLCGAYTLDSETGHVGVQVAHMLGLPFIGPCRSLDVHERVVSADLEVDGGHRVVTATLPLVASAAERLCAPSKASPEQCDAVDPSRIKTLTAADLGLAPESVGIPGSPTWVGPTMRETAPVRPRRRLKAASAAEAIGLIAGIDEADALQELVTQAAALRADQDELSEIWCVPDAISHPLDPGLVAAVAGHAADTGRQGVTVIATDAIPPSTPGMRRLIEVTEGCHAENFASLLAQLVAEEHPHAVVVEGTTWGREVAARVAAELGWGLVGDAVQLTAEQGRVLAWKAAFSGQALVPVESRSPTLLVTVRPGTQTTASELLFGEMPKPAFSRLAAPSVSRVQYGPLRGADLEARGLLSAECVVAVGRGVPPDEYALLDELRSRLDAGPLAATRQVTDAGWLPRSRQIGITGRSIAPRLLVSVGASGKFNHTVGFRNATTVLAINSDPAAPIFDQCDVGLVGDWRALVQELCAHLDSVQPAGQIVG